jgi:hypothetical protein
MEGTVQLGHRMLAIQFQTNRHAQGRIELAYRLVETLAIEDGQPKDSVQTDSLNAKPTANFATEIQG